MIKVKFLGPLSRYQPQENENGVWEVDVANISIADFVATTPLNGVKMGYSATVNQKKEPVEYILKDGDSVSLVPMFYAG